jgi:hypothetical protein
VSDGPEPRERGPRRALRAAVAVPVAVVLCLLAWFGWRASSRDLRPVGLDGGLASVNAVGEHPFDRGERASYVVTWRVGPGEAVSAGRAAFEASRGTDSCHFALDVATVGWAAALYEIRGRIESWTATDLLPSRQEYHVREGRRPTDRMTRFDWASRTFTVGDGEPRPLPPDSRDGLSAWFHARTLPLAPDYRVRLSVVEAGRVYDVDAHVERVERTTIGGREIEAFRLAFLVARASDRGEVARAVAWVSADARRLPLAVDLDTSLGAFRLELDGYQRQSSAARSR